MPTLNDKIISELRRTDVPNMSRLISYMSGDKGFFYVCSGGHDHWTNGTAQHSWRVYQYMRYMWEQAQMNKSSDSDGVSALKENEIILAGLLHDLGKMYGNSHHASNSRKLIDQFLGDGFSVRYPQVVAAIYFHHNAGKDGGEVLNKYRDCTLKRLLSRADSMASGTAWNSTRFINGKSQREWSDSDMRHQRRVALDRTRQMLVYRMYLDCQYELQTVIGYSSSGIGWNAKGDVAADVASGKLKGVHIDEGVHYITAARNMAIGGKRVCVVVGVEDSVCAKGERKLRQNNRNEEDLLICSNILLAFYQSIGIGQHRYAYSMRSEIKEKYKQQSQGKGIFLPDVSFIRDGSDNGFRQVKPWKADVLLIPGWKGAVVLN